MTVTFTREITWTQACPLDRMTTGLGVRVLMDNGEHAALFMLGDGDFRAIGDIDPFSHASVLSRGIVGDHGGELMVASPLKKQAFSLDTGKCLDDPSVSVPTYDVRVVAGIVELGR